MSETFGLGTTEYVHIIRSGYSSLIFEINRVPIPAPVPPPNEWVIWKPEADREYNRARNSTEEMDTLQAIRTLRLLPYHVQNRVNELGTLSVIYMRR